MQISDMGHFKKQIKSDIGNNSELGIKTCCVKSAKVMQVTHPSAVKFCSDAREFYFPPSKAFTSSYTSTSYKQIPRTSPCECGIKQSLDECNATDMTEIRPRMAWVNKTAPLAASKEGVEESGRVKESETASQLVHKGPVTSAPLIQQKAARDLPSSPAARESDLLLSFNLIINSHKKRGDNRKQCVSFWVIVALVLAAFRTGWSWSHIMESYYVQLYGQRLAEADFRAGASGWFASLSYTGSFGSVSVVQNRRIPVGDMN